MSLISAYFLILIAYNKEVIIPAIQMAFNESAALYPDLNINATYYVAPNRCDDFESVSANYLADFYYSKKPPEAQLIIIATGLLSISFLTFCGNSAVLVLGCSAAMVQTAELAKGKSLLMCVYSCRCLLTFQSVISH